MYRPSISYAVLSIPPTSAARFCAPPDNEIMPFFPPPRPFGSILLRIVGVIVLAPLPAIRGLPRLFCAFRAVPLPRRCVDKLLAAHLTAADALSQRERQSPFASLVIPSFLHYLSCLATVGAVPRAGPTIKNNPALATDAGRFRRNTFFHFYCPSRSMRASL